MTVQIQPARPKDQHNGLADLEAEILKAEKGHTITAIVTYERVKRVEDEQTDDYYPVLKVRHIEPLNDAAAIASAQALQTAAYATRTGEEELDLNFEPDEGGDK